MGATPRQLMSEDETVEDTTDEVVEDETIEPTLEEKLAEAIARAEKAEAEITYKDADIINIRKRNASDRAELMKFAGFNLSGRILPVLDSLERALDNAEEGPTDRWNSVDKRQSSRCPSGRRRHSN
ncbi:MAG: hypothetical protein Ct9H90mP16_09750 [Candidatus Poseidoniales archaeon]|nr:MAG: hypothetical protein Ct9H90mP16_09750 [Candidatus Poseidoniales archaeon]